MIKHVAPNSVLSYFNPIVSLKPEMKRLVNRNFLLPIAAQFFSDKGGIEGFEPLDMDKLKTEIDFDREFNFVNSYLYSEVIETIEKDESGEVRFIPKYVFTFDKELTPLSSELIYPYYGLLVDFEGDPDPIAYGCMRLGEAPVLYYIWIDIQMLIQFIKQNPAEVDWENLNYIDQPTEKQKRTAYQLAISEIQREKSRTIDIKRVEILEEQESILKAQVENQRAFLLGKTGRLRINLQWYTTDDLDLHVFDPDRNEIFYGNRSSTCQGKRGELDVDMNAGPPFNSQPQENIAWDIPPIGSYEIWVKLFHKRDTKERIPFVLRILPQNKQGRIYTGSVTEMQKSIKIATFDFSIENELSNVIKCY